MNKGNVELRSFVAGQGSLLGDDKKFSRATYNVTHNNGETTLSQTLTVEQEPISGWVASVEFEKLPVGNTPKEAANKLADWLERMAMTIRVGEFPSLESSPQLIDLDK